MQQNRCLATLLLPLVLLLSAPGLWAKGTAPKPIFSSSFELLWGTYITLPVQLNGSKPLTFVWDSGASRTLLDKTQAERVGLAFDGKETGKAVGGSIEMTFAHDVDLKVEGAEADLNLHFPDIGVVDLSDLQRGFDSKIDGVIGDDFFKLYVVEVDYAARTLNLYAADTYRYRGSGDIVPITFVNNRPFVGITITTQRGNAYDAGVLLDTGDDGVLTLGKAFVDKNKILEQTRKTLPTTTYGAGKTVQSDFLGRLQKIQVGRFQAKSPIVVFSQETEGALSEDSQDGTIGGELLRRFKLILDYSRQRVILEPNAQFSEAYVADMVGMSLRPEGADHKVVLKVDYVMAGSPAAEAGFHIGDLITAINGKEIEALTPELINKMFRREGHEYQLQVKRDGTLLSIKLKTRQLL